MRILLIDDEAMVRKIVRRMLERAGHDVVDAEKGCSGLDLLESTPCDLFLTDIIMPEVEGIEVLTAVTTRFPATKVIAMSGGGRTGNVDFLQVAENLGASATLQKPFTYDALLSAIERSARSGGQLDQSARTQTNLSHLTPIAESALVSELRHPTRA